MALHEILKNYRYPPLDTPENNVVYQNIILGADLQLFIAFLVFYGARFVPVDAVL
jgi:hypothetical protein